MHLLSTSSGSRRRRREFVSGKMQNWISILDHRGGSKKRRWDLCRIPPKIIFLARLCFDPLGVPDRDCGKWRGHERGTREIERLHIGEKCAKISQLRCEVGCCRAIHIGWPNRMGKGPKKCRESKKSQTMPTLYMDGPLVGCNASPVYYLVIFRFIRIVDGGLPARRPTSNFKFLSLSFLPFLYIQ